MSFGRSVSLNSTRMAFSMLFAPNSCTADERVARLPSLWYGLNLVSRLVDIQVEPIEQDASDYKYRRNDFAVQMVIWLQAACLA